MDFLDLPGMIWKAGTEGNRPAFPLSRQYAYLAMDTQRLYVADSNLEWINISGGAPALKQATVVITTNQNIASPPFTTDGYSLNIGDRVLLVGQSTASQNGLYEYDGAVFARPSDYATGNTQQAFSGLAVYVTQGDTYGGSFWILGTSGTITIDTTNTSWNRNKVSATTGFFGTGTPAATAALEIVSTTQGFLGPRMTQTQRDAIASPATGLWVYNTSTDRYNQYSNSAWRIPFVACLYSQGADVTVASPNTAETTIIGSGLGSPTIPAGLLNEVGRTAIIRAVGYATRSVGNTTVKFKIGGNTVYTFGPSATAWGTNHRFEIWFEFTTKSTGATGTVKGSGYFDTFTAINTFVRNEFVQTGTTTLDLTAAQAIDITWQWPTSPGQSATCTGLQIFQAA